MFLFRKSCEYHNKRKEAFVVSFLFIIFAVEPFWFL